MRPYRLPAPTMPLLTPHDEYSMAHLIEQYIDYYTEERTEPDDPSRSIPSSSGTT